MKILLFLFSLLFVNFGFSQSPVELGARIVFDELTYDYGYIDSASNGIHIFNFKNEGNEDLIISNVKSSCGCTIPEWSNAPIAPGQTGTIKVSYNTTRIGFINKTIYVTSNAINQENGLVELKISGNVISVKN